MWQRFHHPNTPSSMLWTEGSGRDAKVQSGTTEGTALTTVGRYPAFTGEETSITYSPDKKTIYYIKVWAVVFVKTTIFQSHCVI